MGELFTALVFGTKLWNTTDRRVPTSFTCNVDRLAASELDRSILPISDCGEAMLPLRLSGSAG